MFVKSMALVFFLFILCAVLNAQRTIDGVRVGIVNGRATYLPKPDYPEKAKEFCAGGKVEIEVLISEKGDVIEAKAISGDELLREVSVEAVRKAKFATYNDAGPVKTRGIIVYNFDSLAKCLNVGVVNKKALKVPKPSVNLSPPKTEAIIAVQIVVDMNGKVTAARAFSGHPLVRSVFEKAARQAEFSPTFINGPPVRVRALLVYKFKLDGSVDTDVERDDKDVIKTPVNLFQPPSLSCNCRFGSANPKVVVMTEIDEQGNVSKAEVVSGHPVLRPASKQAALSSKFLPLNIKSKLFIIYSFEEVDKWSVKFVGIEIKNADE